MDYFLQNLKNVLRRVLYGPAISQSDCRKPVSISFHKIKYNTVQDLICIIFWFQNSIYFWGFSTPEQGRKFKTPVAYSCLINPHPTPHPGIL